MTCIAVHKFQNPNVKGKKNLAAKRYVHYDTVNINFKSKPNCLWINTYIVKT